MSNLFDKSDFALFELYVGRKSRDAPEEHEKLRKVYDKLGSVVAELQRRGYPTDIIRNPQNQGRKYSTYHWSQKGQRAVQGNRKKDVRCSWYARKGTLFTFWAQHQ